MSWWRDDIRRSDHGPIMQVLVALTPNAWVVIWTIMAFAGGLIGVLR